jgi:UDP-2,3-diacylglucosamine pyrophosphatase LpxH
MLSCDALLEKSGGRFQVYRNLRIRTDRDLSEKLTLCIPDMHLLERGPTDDFLDRRPEHEERFLDFLDFLLRLKKEEGDGLEIVQIGDLFDLWQAKGNTNLIVSSYPSILGILQKLKTVYVVGNHDIDLVRWYRDQGQAFGRTWRTLARAEGKVRTLFEHGFQADFFNNQASWSGVIGREVTQIVAMMEYLEPDIDVILGSAWDAVVRVFGKYNAFSPAQDPQGFCLDQYLRYYVELLDKYNQAKTYDAFGPEDLDLSLAVIGHTHSARLVQMPRDGRTYYLLDCGSWVNGGHEVGIIAGNEIAVGQWDLKAPAPRALKAPRASRPKKKGAAKTRAPRRRGR